MSSPRLGENEEERGKEEEVMPHEQAHTFGIGQPKYHLSSATRLEQPDLGLVCQSGPSRRQRTKMIEESFRDYLQNCRRVKKKSRRNRKTLKLAT